MADLARVFSLEIQNCLGKGVRAYIKAVPAKSRFKLQITIKPRIT
jgi:hypothetical protein